MGTDMERSNTDIWRERRDYWRLAAEMSAADSGTRAIAQRMAKKYDRLLERSRKRHEANATEEQAH